MARRERGEHVARARGRELRLGAHAEVDAAGDALEREPALDRAAVVALERLAQRADVLEVDVEDPGGVVAARGRRLGARGAAAGRVERPLVDLAVAGVGGGLGCGCWWVGVRTQPI